MDSQMWIFLQVDLSHGSAGELERGDEGRAHKGPDTNSGRARQEAESGCCAGTYITTLNVTIYKYKKHS